MIKFIQFVNLFRHHASDVRKNVANFHLNGMFVISIWLQTIV